MAEEASNAARAVPLGILSSIGMCCTLSSSSQPSPLFLSSRLLKSLDRDSWIRPRYRHCCVHQPGFRSCDRFTFWPAGKYDRPGTRREGLVGRLYGYDSRLTALQMAQIYYDALGKRGAMGFMAFLFIVQYLMGLSILVAASRQMWAFSRDDALPFSSFLKRIVRFPTLQFA